MVRTRTMTMKNMTDGWTNRYNGDKRYRIPNIRIYNYVQKPKTIKYPRVIIFYKLDL